MGCGWKPELQQLALSFSVSGLLSMVLIWHDRGFKISPVEMTEIATAILTKPLVEKI